MRVPHATAAHDENGHDGAVSHGHFSPVDLVLPVARDDVPPPVVVPFVSYYVLRYVFLFFLLFSSFFERGAFFYFLHVFFFCYHGLDFGEVSCGDIIIISKRTLPSETFHTPRCS